MYVHLHSLASLVLLKECAFILILGTIQLLKKKSLYIILIE